jgi:hypothetical protein
MDLPEDLLALLQSKGCTRKAVQTPEPIFLISFLVVTRTGCKNGFVSGHDLPGSPANDLYSLGWLESCRKRRINARALAPEGRSCICWLNLCNQLQVVAESSSLTTSHKLPISA